MASPKLQSSRPALQPKSTGVGSLPLTAGLDPLRLQLFLASALPTATKVRIAAVETPSSNGG
jgi:hypothetical protein